MGAGNPVCATHLLHQIPASQPLGHLGRSTVRPTLDSPSVRRACPRRDGGRGGGGLGLRGRAHVRVEVVQHLGHGHILWAVRLRDLVQVVRRHPLVALVAALLHGEEPTPLAAGPLLSRAAELSGESWLLRVALTSFRIPRRLAPQSSVSSLYLSTLLPTHPGSAGDPAPHSQHAESVRLRTRLFKAKMEYFGTSFYFLPLIQR